MASKRIFHRTLHLDGSNARVLGMGQEVGVSVSGGVTQRGLPSRIAPSRIAPSRIDVRNEYLISGAENAVDAAAIVDQREKQVLIVDVIAADPVGRSCSP